MSDAAGAAVSDDGPMSDDGPASDVEIPEHAPGPARVRAGRAELEAEPVAHAERLELAVTVVVAVPDEARRARLVAELDAATGIEVLGEGGSDEEAINAALATAPTVTLVDVDPTGGFDGRTVCLVLADKLATSAVVAVSAEEDDHLFEALRLGARSVCRPEADATMLAAVVRGVARGEADLGPGAAAWLLAEIDRLAEDADLDPAARPDALSDLEQDVLGRRAEGATWEQIAATHQLTRRLVATAAGTALAKVHRSLRLGRELELVRRARS